MSDTASAEPSRLSTKKKIKIILAPIVILITLGVFAYYIHGHPDSIRQLSKLPLTTLGLLLLLYVVFLVILTWIQRATLTLCDIRLGRKESLLLVSYSSIINFFGPLQSGPAFRAAYLKRKHGIKLKNYTVATLLYYGFFAAFSGLFLMVFFIGPYALLGILLIALLTPVVLQRKPKLVPTRFRHLRLEHIGNLAAATLAQVSLVAVIFYNELNSLGQHVGAIPTLIYTGAANFALFVSFTPGAIGFRESFLVFSQRLHGLSGQQIVAASLIDRGVYILFLGLLAALVFGLHAERFLKARSNASNTTTSDKTSDL